MAAGNSYAQNMNPAVCSHGAHPPQPPQLHRRQTPNNNNNKSQQIACRLCHQIFSSSQALINHIETHITEEDMVLQRRNQFLLLQQQQQHQQQQQLNSFHTNSLIIPSERNVMLMMNNNGIFLPTNNDNNANNFATFIQPGQGQGQAMVIPYLARQVVIPQPPPPLPPTIPAAVQHTNHPGGQANFYEQHSSFINGGFNKSIARANIQPNTPQVLRSAATSASSVGKRRRVVEEEEEDDDDDDVVELNPADKTRPFVSLLDRPLPNKPKDFEVGNEEEMDLTLKLWPLI